MPRRRNGNERAGESRRAVELHVPVLGEAEPLLERRRSTALSGGRPSRREPGNLLKDALLASTGLRCTSVTVRFNFE